MKYNKTPVTVIGFVRKEVLDETLYHLSQADGVLEREVLVYLSCPRNDAERATTDSVKAVVVRYQKSSLPNITIIERDKNEGASKNVRYAIDSTLAKYNQTCVLEEDVLVSKTYLRYMDAALDFYKDDKRVWCINGHKNPFLRVPRSYPHEVFLNPRNMSWGFAIWKDRWTSVDFSISDWPEYKKNSQFLEKVVRAGSDMPKMLDSEYAGGGKTWDVQCSFHLLKHDLYAVEGIYSQVKTNGFNTVGSVNCHRPHGYYEKQKYYNFMPKFVSYDVMKAGSASMRESFRYTISDHRLLPFAYRCIMRVLKHFIGPGNNDPKDI